MPYLRALRDWAAARPKMLAAWALLIAVPVLLPVLAFGWLKLCVCCWRVLFGN